MSPDPVLTFLAEVVDVGAAVGVLEQCLPELGGPPDLLLPIPGLPPDGERAMQVRSASVPDGGLVSPTREMAPSMWPISKKQVGWIESASA